MSRSQPPHDALFKATFSQLRNLVGELRAMLPSSLIDALDFSTAALVPRSFVDIELRERHTDLLWSVELRGRPAFLYVLLEHKSRADRLTSFQMLVYLFRTGY